MHERLKKLKSGDYEILSQEGNTRIVRVPVVRAEWGEFGGGLVALTTNVPRTRRCVYKGLKIVEVVGDVTVQQERRFPISRWQTIIESEKECKFYHSEGRT